MDIFKGLGKIDWTKSEKFNLHTKVLNKDILLDIVRKSIKFLTVILKSSMKGSMSHFFDVGHGSFFMLCRRKVNIIFHIFLLFTF